MALLLALPLAADEGMWPFNRFPKDQVKAQYGFEVTDGFLDRLRLASLRIGAGSGSFVSPKGLVSTSYRVAADCLAKTGTESFYAAAESDEAPCPGLAAEVLQKIDEVKKDALPRAEQECAAAGGSSCSVVKLYSGERYDLYRYKRYTDLRLVFAPERGIALFGGDADSFTYPRYDLDAVFLRAYENGRPADTPHYLKWSTEGVKDGELVFVAGNPRATSRLDTAAQLAFARDVSLPLEVARLQARITALRPVAVGRTALMELDRAYKSDAGKLIGLKDTRLMARKQNLDKRLRSSVANDPKLGAEAAKVWDEIAAAYKSWTPYEKAYQVLERPAAEGSQLFRMARQAVRRETESKPSGPAAISEAVEIAMLAVYFEELKALGEKEAPVKAILGARTPQQAAEEYVRGSKPGATDDPMIKLARLLEEPARKLRKKHEETIEAVEASGAARIARYRLQVFGDKEYPDATSTPRLAFGAVKAYRDKTEAPVPYATTFGGMYHRAGPEDPYRLPPRWAGAKGALDLVMPFDFATTADIADGNAGGVAVNQKGEIVGVVFDGNIESLANTYLYSDEQARAIAVASQGLVEALRKLYRATRLLAELGP
jgi:hypothetical protein